MNKLREEIRKEMDSLVKQGTSFLERKGKGKRVYPDEYQRWYTVTLAIVRQLIPERLKEFEELYKIENRKTLDCTTYTISDYLLGLRVLDETYGTEVFKSKDTFLTKFHQQLAILKSAYARLDSILTDIYGVLRANIFDNELDAAISLLQARYLRAAGTVAGVILESHLSTICNNHNIIISKRNPALADYNDKLKNESIFDVPTWRWIQRLADIRNLCSHAKQRDPTTEEVEELINGVKKAVKTLF